MVKGDAGPVGGGGHIGVRQEDAVLGDALEACVVLARLERRHRCLRGGKAFVVYSLLEGVDDVGWSESNRPKHQRIHSLEGGEAGEILSAVIIALAEKVTLGKARG